MRRALTTSAWQASGDHVCHALGAGALLHTLHGCASVDECRERWTLERVHRQLQQLLRLHAMCLLHASSPISWGLPFCGCVLWPGPCTCLTCHMLSDACHTGSCLQPGCCHMHAWWLPSDLTPFPPEGLLSNLLRALGAVVRHLGRLLQLRLCCISCSAHCIVLVPGCHPARVAGVAHRPCSCACSMGPTWA
jgi:hypothetical protein